MEIPLLSNIQYRPVRRTLDMLAIILTASGSQIAKKLQQPIESACLHFTSQNHGAVLGLSEISRRISFVNNSNECCSSVCLELVAWNNGCYRKSSREGLRTHIVCPPNLSPLRETKKMTCASLAHGGEPSAGRQNCVLPYAQLRLTAHIEEAHALTMPETTRLYQAPSSLSGR